MGESSIATAFERNAKEAKSLQEKIKAKALVIKRTDYQTDSVLEELEAIERRLNETRLKTSAIGQELDDQAGKLHQLHGRKEVLKKALKENEGYLKLRLNALYRVKLMKQHTPFPPPKRLIEQVARHRALSTIINKDVDLLEIRQTQLSELQALEAALQIEAEEKKRLEKAFTAEMHALKREGKKQQKLLEKIKKEKTLHLAAMAALKKAAADLNRRLRAMAHKNLSRQNIEKKTLGQIKRPSSPFDAIAGTLDMPVNGRIISKFGPEKNNDYSTFTFQSGIDISTDRGEPVKSIFKGTVVYSQWLRGYGNVIIIDHGNSYYTLYAHLEERFKQKGSRVATREVIATAGDTGSMKGVHLHFEVRHHGTPVDPMKWLKKGA